MLASSPRFRVAAAFVASCLLVCATPAPSVAQQTAPAVKKPAPAKKKPAAPVKKPAAKPLPPAPPPPPPPVELIGHIVMPPDALRPGPPSGQFDGEGRRAAAPRFDAQPVQGVSSIKPGPTPGAWWGLSDNGFGRKWNSPDYHLAIYLFDVRPRTQTGPDSRTALQGDHRAVGSRQVLSLAAGRRELARTHTHRCRRRSGITGHHVRRHVLDRRRVRTLAAALLGGRRLAGSARGTS